MSKSISETLCQRQEKNVEKRSAPRYRIDVSETKSTLIRYKWFPTCLTPRPYRYRSVTHEARVAAAGVSRERRSGYRYPLSPRVISKVGAWHEGGVRRECRRKTNVISPVGFAKVRGAVEFS